MREREEVKGGTAGKYGRASENKVRASEPETARKMVDIWMK